jgi:hypothetical protein
LTSHVVTWNLISRVVIADALNKLVDENKFVSRHLLAVYKLHSESNGRQASPSANRHINSSARWDDLVVP